MKIICGKELLGKKAPEELNSKFLRAGYLHVEECTGDGRYYYRYYINGLIVDLEEQEVHWMTQEPKRFLEFLFSEET